MPNIESDYDRFAVLVYTSNNCYEVVHATTVIDGFSLDVEANSWTFDGETFEIGRMQYGFRYGGVIGVYDKNNLDHLTSMIRHAQEATTLPSGPFDCDT